MSELARWSYTAKATIWPLTGTDEWNKPSYGAPVVIDCDYGGDGKRGSGSFGLEFVVKMTFWTEYADAKIGDMIALGDHSDAVPNSDADEVRHVIQYADTFERSADDFAVITGV